MKKQKTDLQIKKDEIRKQILEKRSSLSLEEVNKKSELIIENLAPYLKNAQNIMIFTDMKNYERREGINWGEIFKKFENLKI